MANINAGQVTWNLDVVDAGFSSGVKEASAQAKGLDRQLSSIDFSKLASNAGNAFSGIASSIENTVKKVALLTIGSGALGATFIAQAAQLQQTNQGFQTLIGNTQIANRLFGQLVQYANVTPFQSKDITSAARTLLGFGLNAQQTYDTIKKLGDIAGATGGDFQALALVTGQIFAQGKIQAQDFYQIINSGAGALGPLIAQNLGYKGVGQLRDAFDQGKVTAAAFFGALNEATTQGGFAFQGAQKQAETFNGRLSTLKDSMSQFGLALLGVKIDPQLGLIVQPGGVFDRLSKLITNLTPQIQALAPRAASFVDAIIRNGPTIISVLEGIGAAFIVAKLAAIGFAVAAALANPFQAIALGVTILIGVITFLQSRFDIFGKAVRGLITAYDATRNALVGAFNAVKDAVLNAYKATGDFLGAVGAAIWAGIQAAIGAVKDAIHAVGDALAAIGRAAASVFGAIRDWVERNRRAIENVSIVIGTLLLPKFAQIAGQAAVAAARTVASWAVAGAQMVASTAVSSAEMVAQFTIASASATKNAAIASAVWVKNAALATAAWIREMPRMIAQFAVVSARAIASAAITSAAWVAAATVTAARWIATFAIYLAQVAIAVAGTLVAAAQFALAWLLALGPIGLVIAVVIGLAALIIANWDTVKGWLIAFWDWLKNAALANWEAIKAGFSSIGSFFAGVWNTIVGIFGRVGTAVGNAISGSFKAVINTVISLAEAEINTFIRTLNGAIGIINKIPKVNIPKLGEFNLPRLASGGIVPATPGGTMAVLGEGGQDEVVIPLDKLQSVATKTGGGSSVTVHLHMDGIMARSRGDLREIARDMVGALNEELRARRLPEIAGGKL